MTQYVSYSNSLMSVLKALSSKKLNFSEFIGSKYIVSNAVLQFIILKVLFSKSNIQQTQCYNCCRVPQFDYISQMEQGPSVMGIQCIESSTKRVPDGLKNPQISILLHFTKALVGLRRLRSMPCISCSAHTETC